MKRLVTAICGVVAFASASTAEAADSCSVSPLRAAVREGDASKTARLLKKGHDVDEVSPCWGSVLHQYTRPLGIGPPVRALKTRHHKMPNFLRTKGFNFAAPINSTLLATNITEYEKADKAFLEKLVEAGAKVESSSLRKAITWGRLPLLEWLVAKGGDPNGLGVVLAAAVEARNRPNLIRFLLDKGATGPLDPGMLKKCA